MQNEPLDDLGGHNTLLGVKVGGGLVDQVNIRLGGGGVKNFSQQMMWKVNSGTYRLSETENQGNTLKLTTREVLHLLVQETINLERADDVSLELRVVEHIPDLRVEELSHSTLKKHAQQNIQQPILK